MIGKDAIFKIQFLKQSKDVLHNKQIINSILYFTPKARFRRRAFHEPNLIHILLE
jgi:hypothetical protein